MRHMPVIIGTIVVLASTLVAAEYKLQTVENQLDTSTVAVADRQPTWCNWPEPADQVALTKAVNVEVANIHKYSPDYTPDRFTIQLDLMSWCGIPANVRP